MSPRRGIRPEASAVLSLAFLSVLAVSLFLLSSERGFPLDDAWIHQTYARNLARYHQWAYVPGQVSAGSTAPLWTLLITPAYLLGLDPFAWTWALGVLSLVGTAWVTYRLAVRLSDGDAALALATGAFCAVEWHLVWAALSGMETALFAFASLFLTERYLALQDEKPRSPLSAFRVGLLAGLLALVRPEGLMLATLLAADAALREGAPGFDRGRALRAGFVRWFRWVGVFALGVASCLAGYVAFNLWASGHPFPNTFYAKAAEYRVLVERLPLWVRLWDVALPTLVGAQLLLVPGFVAAWLVEFRRAWGERFRRGIPVLLLWWAAVLLAYALRLPVGYQHGRYTMPVIPVFVLYGMLGMRELASRLPGWGAVRVARTAWMASVAILLAAFLFLGARAYDTDVRIIRCEMVQTALWLREGTPPDALVAVHDIGAIGYYSERPLLDLAGLVTPEVIPFIRDENRLRDFILSRGADFLVTFPSWYPRLTKDPAFKPIYGTGCLLTIQEGGENMTVYAVRRSP